MTSGAKNNSFLSYVLSKTHKILRHFYKAEAISLTEFDRDNTTLFSWLGKQPGICCPLNCSLLPEGFEKYFSGLECEVSHCDRE